MATSLPIKLDVSGRVIDNPSAKMISDFQKMEVGFQIMAEEQSIEGQLPEMPQQGPPMAGEDVVVEDVDMDMIAADDRYRDDDFIAADEEDYDRLAEESDAQIGRLREVEAVGLEGKNSLGDDGLPLGNSFLPNGESPAHPAVYKHHDLGVKYILKHHPLSDAERAGIEKKGKESPFYRGILAQKWKEVVRVHKEHGLPAVRVDKMDFKSDDFGESYTAAMGGVTGLSAPVLAGWDQMALFGAGRHTMGIANEKLVATPAQRELQRNGTVPPMAELLNDLGDRSTAGYLVGAGLGLTLNPASMPLNVLMGGAKTAAKAITGGGKGTGMLTAGLVALGETVGAETSKVAAEFARQGAPERERDMGSLAGEALGAGMGMHGVLGIGAGAAKWLHGRMRNSTAAGKYLAQLEKATGEGGTQILGGGAGGAKVIEGSRTEKLMKMRRREFTEATVGPTKEIRKTAERVGNTLNLKTEKMKADHEWVSDQFYASPQGSAVQYNANNVLAKMKAELKSRLKIEARPLTGTALGLAPTQLPGKPGSPAKVVKPSKAAKEGAQAGFLLDNRQLEKAIKQFDELHTTNGDTLVTAEQMDQALRGVDEIMRVNKRELQSNKFMRELQREIRVVRDRVEGGPGTDGQMWGAVKKRQGEEITALENAKRAAGFKQEGDVTVANEDTLTSIVDSMRVMGLPSDGGRVPEEVLYDAIKSMNPALLKELKETIAYFPTAALQGLRAPIPHGTSQQAMGSAAVRAGFDQWAWGSRIDPIMDMAQKYQHSAEAGAFGAMQTPSGTGSERAIAALESGGSEAIGILGQLARKAVQMASEEEE